ncbi:hypothetical protein XFF6992_200106 [Xanthomonas citri pv. fuscans]|nr:hypothetical protein XFF6992_200106 [Xanthomonas citri pv. fuscans]SOO31080.1 hypothetical protein XFF6994_1220008 [Xanthomonas citri pv. fuscans]
MMSRMYRTLTPTPLPQGEGLSSFYLPDIVPPHGRAGGAQRRMRVRRLRKPQLDARSRQGPLLPLFVAAFDGAPIGASLAR